MTDLVLGVHTLVLVPGTSGFTFSNTMFLLIPLCFALMQEMEIWIEETPFHTKITRKKKFYLVS